MVNSHITVGINIGDGGCFLGEEGAITVISARQIPYANETCETFIFGSGGVGHLF